MNCHHLSPAEADPGGFANAAKGAPSPFGDNNGNIGVPTQQQAIYKP